MKAAVIVALVLAATMVASHPVSAPAPAPERAPTFVINLDEDPETRWSAVVPQYRNAFNESLAFLNKFVPQWADPIVFPFFEFIDTLFGDYGKEMKGIANQTGIPLGQIVMINLVYDLTAFCTSIVAQNDKGVIFHSRNLDYEIPGFIRLRE